MLPDRATFWSQVGMFQVKILIVGPAQSGKTTLANYLADATQTVGEEYWPTQGVRILEFEYCPDSSSNGLRYEVELWDCSGDRKFEKCWPAMRKGASGVMLVFDPAKLNDVQELEAWHNAFVRHSGLLEAQCLLVAHQKPGSHGDVKKHDLPVALRRLQKVDLNLDDKPEKVSEEFRSFVLRVKGAVSASREQDELSIVGS
uniref:intraflagellar transport protein 22 homolog n=1 Tax=Myxine glutinosa TaxID=7769 RepID=UPI00358E23F2